MCVQAIMMVDSLTWLVLVPMLRSNPDPEKVRWAEKMFFNFYSYNTVRIHCVSAISVSDQGSLRAFRNLPVPAVYEWWRFVGLYLSDYCSGALISC